jgi:hypothetical protein
MQLLTMLEVLQHLRGQTDLHDLESLVLKEMTSEAVQVLEDEELRCEMLDLLPEVFESRLDACVFCDTLPVDVNQVNEFFEHRLSLENAQHAANLARQLRGEQVVEYIDE